MSAKAFGKRLAKLRVAAGLSQSALARVAKMSQSAISQIESGNREPSFGTLTVLAHGVGVTVQELVAETRELSEREQTLLQHYRRLTKSEQASLAKYAAFLAGGPVR